VLDSFLAMGGYARFVWTAYGLAGVVFVWNVWSTVRLQRRAELTARRRLAAGFEHLPDGRDHERFP